MPFKQVLERNVNKNMESSEQGPVPRDTATEEVNMKKLHGTKNPDCEEEDEELSEKKDRPPRFSSIFAATPEPQVTERYVEPKRKSGVYIPTPLFVVFALILLFESTLLFAYTIIGLYNNAPSGLLPFGPSPALMNDCDCGSRQPAINIAPNFVMPQGQAAKVTVTVGGAQSADATSTSSRTSTSSISKTIAALPKGAVASDVESILGTLLPTTTTTTRTPSTEQAAATSTKFVTASIPQSTVDSTTVISVNNQGSTLAPPKTITSVKVVPPAPSGVAAKEASIKSELSLAKAALTPEPIPTPSTLQTSKKSPPATAKAPSPTVSAPPSTTTTKATATYGPCFGGAGAVELNCIGGV